MLLPRMHKRCWVTRLAGLREFPEAEERLRTLLMRHDP